MPESYVEDIQYQLDLDEEENHHIEQYEDIESSLERRRTRGRTERSYPDNLVIGDVSSNGRIEPGESYTEISLSPNREPTDVYIRPMPQRLVANQRGRSKVIPRTSKKHVKKLPRTLSPPKQHYLAPPSSRRYIDYEERKVPSHGIDTEKRVLKTMKNKRQTYLRIGSESSVGNGNGLSQRCKKSRNTQIPRRVSGIQIEKPSSPRIMRTARARPKPKKPVRLDNGKYVNAKKTQLFWFSVRITLDVFCRKDSGWYHKDFDTVESIEENVVPMVIEFLRPSRAHEEELRIVDRGVFQLERTRPENEWGQ